MKKDFGIKGKVTVTEKDGTKLWESDNLILNSGVGCVVSMIGVTTRKPYSIIAVGTSAATANVSQSGLQGNSLRDGSTTVSMSALNQFRAHTIFEPGSDETHYEAVFANDDVTGSHNCLSRVVMPDGINIEANKEITYTWEITVV